MISVCSSVRDKQLDELGWFFVMKTHYAAQQHRTYFV
jgi:hypothetical protein